MCTKQATLTTRELDQPAQEQIGCRSTKRVVHNGDVQAELGRRLDSYSRNTDNC